MSSRVDLQDDLLSQSYPAGERMGGGKIGKGNLGAKGLLSCPNKTDT